MPQVLRDNLSVHIIQSRDHILNTYAEKISEYAEERFRRNEIDLITNARVKEVHGDKVVYTVKDPKTGATSEKEIDCGFTLWSTGIGAHGPPRALSPRRAVLTPLPRPPSLSSSSCAAMNPFTQRVASLLPNQYHKHALEVDSHLRVLGAPLGTVYALGDCATIETRLVDHLLEFVERCDEDQNGEIDRKEFEKMMGVRPRPSRSLTLSPAPRVRRADLAAVLVARSTSSASSLRPRSTSTRSSASSSSLSFSPLPLPHAIASLTDAPSSRSLAGTSSSSTSAATARSA